MKVKLYFLLCSFVLFFGCSPITVTPSLEKEKFLSPSGSPGSSKSFLALDLSNDQKPKMGLVITNKLEYGFQKTIIPFNINKANVDNNGLYSTYGKHKNVTLLTFLTDSNTPDYSSIAFDYEFTTQKLPKAYTNSQRIDSIDSILTINQYGALGRQVIYSYKKERDLNGILKKEIKTDYDLKIDSIAISIPKESTRTQVVSGKTDDPPHIDEIDEFTRFYPNAKNAEPNDFLEIRYLIPEPDNVEFTSNLLLGLFAPVMAGIVALYAIKNEDIENPGQRLLGLIVLVIVQFIIVVGLGYYYQFISTKNRQKVILTITPVVVASLTTLGIFMIKKPSSNQEKSIDKVAQKVQNLLDNLPQNVDLSDYDTQVDIAKQIVQEIQNDDDLKKLVLDVLKTNDKDLLIRKINHKLDSYIVTNLYLWKDSA